MENKYNFDQLKKFIEKESIKSRSEFSAKFERVYKKSFLPLTEEEKNLLLPSLNPNYYGYLNTKDDFKLFFEENRILSRSDLNRRFKNCYDRFMTVLTKEEQSEILPTSQSYVYIKTKDDLKRFIVDNNIKSRRQLSKKFSGVAARFYGILTKEERDEILPLNRRDFSNVVDFESFKIFIENNNILSRKDLAMRFDSVYRKFQTLLTDEEKDLLLPTINSLGEEFLCELFTSNSIKYTTEKTYVGLCGRSKVRLRYDFYLPEFNILVEYHGPQHFDENDPFYSHEGILRDKQKFEYAKENSITLLYFTNEIEIYNKFGYFTEVLTDSSTLIRKIKKLD